MDTLHIIGAKGNIGSRLVEKTEGKYNIRKVVSPARSNLFSVDSGYYVLNLADDIHTYNFDTLKEGDIVAFTAAISAPSVCAEQFDVAMKVNVESTGEFIQQALDRGCKVIFLSSDAVYGRSEDELDESQPLNPLGVYAKMKVIVEKRFIGNSKLFNGNAMESRVKAKVKTGWLKWERGGKDGVPGWQRWGTRVAKMGYPGG